MFYLVFSYPLMRVFFYAKKSPFSGALITVLCYSPDDLPELFLRVFANEPNLATA